MARILGGAARSEFERRCRAGDAHAAAGELAEALACYLEAWELLPEPREDYADAARVFRGFTRIFRSRGALGGGLDALTAGRHHLAPALAAMGWRASDD